MSSKMKHLLFYDGKCGVCARFVHFLLRQDKKQLFVFSPLQGETAKELLKDLPEAYKEEDTLVLVENYQSPERKFYILAQGTFRIAWLLGGFWKLIGWICFLPHWTLNWAYRFVASHRKQLFSAKLCPLPEPKSNGRFLP